MKRYTILLLLFFFLTACNDPVNLNQVITQEITTETTSLQNNSELPHGEKLWYPTEIVGHAEELHGQVISLVGYVGWQGSVSGNSWAFDLWDEPVGNYEDIWKSGHPREYDDPLDKWNVCWTDCWQGGKDYLSVAYASGYPERRPEELPDVDPSLTFAGHRQDKPETTLVPLDKYVIKVLIKDWGLGNGMTLVEIVEHIEMPKEQPPESINEDNPMSVKEFEEQYENFYDQTVSVRGWIGGFGTDAYGIDSFGFHNEDPNSAGLTDNLGITVLFPYNERAYYWKMTKYQGARAGGPYILRIHVHSPETHTVRFITNVEIKKEFPFVILWVDGKDESE